MRRVQTENIHEWFSQQLDKKESGCWEWKRYKTQKGYGQFHYNGKTTFTHRFVLETKLGRPIFEGFMACHSCHNRACCNPDHIREGTARENTRDMMDANRQATGEQTVQRGEKHGMSKLTTDEVIEIRNLYGLESVHQIARLFGVSASAISNIHLRKTWVHV
jgi:hypothetical protein